MAKEVHTAAASAATAAYAAYRQAVLRELQPEIRRLIDAMLAVKE